MSLVYGLTHSRSNHMADVARDPAILKRKKLRRVLYGVVGLLLVALVSTVLARMKRAAPSVDRNTLLIDTVKRGRLVRQVRGLGTLVPEDTRWLPASTDGRVERILLQPGALVTPGSVILELSNPQVEQEAIGSRLALESAEAALENLRSSCRTSSLPRRRRSRRSNRTSPRRNLNSRRTTRLRSRNWYPSWFVANQSCARHRSKPVSILKPNECPRRKRPSKRGPACRSPPSTRRERPWRFNKAGWTPSS